MCVTHAHVCPGLEQQDDVIGKAISACCYEGRLAQCVCLVDVIIAQDAVQLAQGERGRSGLGAASQVVDCWRHEARRGFRS